MDEETITLTADEMSAIDKIIDDTSKLSDQEIKAVAYAIVNGSLGERLMPKSC